MGSPRTSSCSPWIDGGQLAQQVWVAQAVIHAKAQSNVLNSELNLTDEQIATILASSAEAATEILYRKSAKMFTGICGPVTIRPTARPVDMDTRGWINRAWSYGGAGSMSMMTGGEGPVMSQYGPQYPPILEISTVPVREIVQVKIDGTVIPPNEYELREFKQLVRMLPSATATPTARWGWPTSQRTDLPDTEFGTFSVTYIYGADPGEAGRNACLKLAEALALPQLGDATHYPTRVSSFSRQGVTAQVASVLDVINKNKGTGIFEVDLWLSTVNPGAQSRQAVIFSPDRVPNRRQAKP